MDSQFTRYRALGRIAAALTLLVALGACAGLRFASAPAISLSPPNGGPGTRVVVTGSGFPAATPLSIRLGPPDVGATPQTYGEGASDASGNLCLEFEIPAQWPDGSPVTEDEILVVVLNEDGSVKAVAPFLFRPALAATRLDIQP
jgi:hypothetical protein